MTVLLEFTRAREGACNGDVLYTRGVRVRGARRARGPRGRGLLSPDCRQRLRGRRPLRVPEVLGLGADGGMEEEVEQGDLPADQVLEARMQPRQQQGVAPEIEEVVAEADPADTQHLGPQPCHALLGAGAAARPRR